MKKNTLLTIALFIGIILLSCSNPKTLSLEEQLQNIPNASVQKIAGDTTFKEYYELYFTQPLDHNNPKLGNFKQRVLLGSRDLDKPMVVELQGYNIWTEKAGELSKLLDANQLTIEHRFFENSKPDSLNWKYLNIKQAAADQHTIIQTLKKIYKGKWISTGISKGGQTTIYHRYFYPNDVEVSVPYVAPMNLSREDERINQYLNTVGNKSTRDKITQFQLRCFKQKKQLIPLAKTYAEKHNYHFSMDMDKVLDLLILEYPFAFWQWGTTPVDSIPPAKATSSEIVKHLAKVSDMNFFSKEGIEPLKAFFYQALTEIGMYNYDIEPFKKYLKNYDKNLTFDHTFPNTKLPPFKAESMQKVNNWLQTDANKMLFIYGEYDPWNATSVVLKDNQKCKKYVKQKGSHRTRIKSFPDSTQTEIIDVIKEWIK
ncbi:MAG: peptidase [Ignavibacteriae bacterium]|nr:MAG: peptidase [Ignavibacteriota bacterium]